MIKLFGSAGPDHPMADPKEAKRILDELPAQDPIMALEELGHWHESLSQAEGLRPERRGLRDRQVHRAGARSLSSQAAISAISSPQTECAMAYSFHCTV